MCIKNRDMKKSSVQTIILTGDCGMFNAKKGKVCFLDSVGSCFRNYNFHYLATDIGEPGVVSIVIIMENALQTSSPCPPLSMKMEI